MPTTSSITTTPGSSMPRRRARCEAAATPAAKTATVSATCQATGASAIGQKSSRPTAEPAVPGATGEYPEPRPVAINVATGCGRRGTGIESEDELTAGS